jgi:hypothetical protein
VVGAGRGGGASGCVAVDVVAGFASGLERSAVGGAAFGSAQCMTTMRTRATTTSHGVAHAGETDAVPDYCAQALVVL